MSKTQRWEWAIGLKLEELNDSHLQAAYKLNWDNLCKFDSCRKNCKRILCLACFDKSWIDNDASNNSYDSYETTNCEQKRTDLKTFVGLKNLGATCYVNCLLQLWFHNPALRKAIYEWDRARSVEKVQDSPETDSANDKQGRYNESETENTTKQNTTPEHSSQTLKRQREDELQLPPNKKVNSSSTTNYSKTQTTIDTPDSKDSNAIENSSSAFMCSPTSKAVAKVKAITPPTTINARNNVVSRSPKQSKDSVQTNPIEQLQLIFARMQFTNKKSIDPFNFINSLALNATEQQDAQEFGNLFMEFLERSFANQKNSFVSKIIQNQFFGKYSYATICDHCKHNSLSDSKFYELDLSIQNQETLHDCLNEYFGPKPLDGKYNCSHCQKAQSAHRTIILKSLPPTLNLQLLRFVYDVQRNIRQKLNSHIIFPEVLDMGSYLESGTSVRSKRNNADSFIGYNNNHGSLYSNGSHQTRSSIYILSAVLIHRGSSPHSGHYIAHIKDRITKDWYKFNDDSVERIGPQLQVSSDGENITIVEDKTEIVKVADPKTNRVTKYESKSLKSKTAYMLVYQAQDNEALTYPSDNSDEWILPDHLQTAVLEENSRSDELFESLQIAKEVDQQFIQARKNQIKEIYDKLICRDPSDEFEFIDKSWLQNWLTNSSSNAKFAPIDNQNLLCTHDKLDFRKLDSVKCVRSEGADLLYQEYGGGPRLRDAMCKKCVELEVKLIQLKDRMKEDQKYITSQAKFKLEADYDFADAFIVGKNSYRDWQALVMHQFEKSHPELVNRKSNKNSNGNQHTSSDEDERNSKENQQESNNRPSGNPEQSSDSEDDDDVIEKFIFNSDVLCEHNQLINDTSAWRIVPKEVWAIFKNYFGNDPARPLIEYNANTLMCAECKKQEVEQQEIGDIQKLKASEEKSKLMDLFHNRKRSSWCTVLPGDIYFALDRQFLNRWQKFIRNPCHQERPTDIKNNEKLICEHGMILYNMTNSDPVTPESPFVLINRDELEALKQLYPIDSEIKFIVDPQLADEKLKLYAASLKTSPNKKTLVVSGSDGMSSIDCKNLASLVESSKSDASKVGSNLAEQMIISSGPSGDELDYNEIDWSECIKSDPEFCSTCHEMLKQDELKKLLNYESATVYITRVENSVPYGPQNCSSSSTINGNSSNLNCPASNSNTSSLTNCDNEIEPNLTGSSNTGNKRSENLTPDLTEQDVAVVGEQQAFKRRKKVCIEDEGNDFVPPGVTKQALPSTPVSNSILRRTTRRNRNREQAYVIKPNQTLLELKKDIFLRCQVLPVDQRLFLNDVLLDDNSKTMSDLRIVPNCSLKLEVSLPTFLSWHYIIKL